MSKDALKTALTAAVVMLLVALCIGQVCASNLANDFSYTQNPNGRWTYGYVTNSNWNFTTYNRLDALTYGGNTAYGWHDYSGWDNYGRIIKNYGPNQMDIPGWYFYMERNHVVAGQSVTGGTSTTVKWTPPSAGTFNIDVRFTCQGYITGGTSADVYVVKKTSGGTVTYLSAGGASGQRIAGFMGRATNDYTDGSGSPGNRYRYYGRAISLAATDVVYLTVKLVSAKADVGIESEINADAVDMMKWFDSMLPEDTYVAVNFEHRDNDQLPWVDQTGVYQPFKSRADRLWKKMYWRKDDMADFYGELFSYDNNVVRLHTETFPPKTPVDPPGQPNWDARWDRVRVFVQTTDPDWSLGRTIAPTNASTTWTYNGSLNTFIANNLTQLNTCTAPQYQWGVQDSVSISRVAPFNAVFDGVCTGWPADSTFQSFDEAICINQCMNSNAARERFWFARKGGTYYGIVRWDNSVMQNGNWVVIDRTVGLTTQTNAAMSFAGFETRVLQDHWIAPFKP